MTARSAPTTPPAAHSMAQALAHPAADVPPGFVPFPAGGNFMHINGPLYLLHQGEVVKFGMRVQERHINPMGNLHGGMMASFCDMLLPLSVHYQDAALADRFLPTISLQIDYLAPSPLGCWLEGTGQLLRATRSMVFAQGLVTADGVPCARASGVFKLGPQRPQESTAP